VLNKLFSGRSTGTFFAPSGLPMEARKRWLAYFQRPTGTIAVNLCAVPVLREHGRSLLAVASPGADGGFAAGDIVNVAGPDGAVFARGMASFGEEEIPRIARQDHRRNPPPLPRSQTSRSRHRDNLVLL